MAKVRLVRFLIEEHSCSVLPQGKGGQKRMGIHRREGTIVAEAEIPPELNGI